MIWVFENPEPQVFFLHSFQALIRNAILTLCLSIPRGRDSIDDTFNVRGRTSIMQGFWNRFHEQYFVQLGSAHVGTTRAKFRRRWFPSRPESIERIPTDAQDCELVRMPKHGSQTPFRHGQIEEGKAIEHPISLLPIAGIRNRSF